MLAASGCHKDSFNFDEFTRPTTATPDTNPDNDDGTGTPDDGDEIPVPMNLPVVSIATGDMPIEDGAGVTLTITSSETVPATLTGGLSVTINIVGADAADFNNAVCTDIVCIVTIPVGGMTVSLILSPLSDFSTETERWTATLEDGDDYNLDAGNNNVGFDITDLIAVVDIMTSDTTAIENGAVTLTITSDLAAPAGGLSVTIDISGNGLMTGEFTTNADCTGLQCVVIIPVGGMTVSLILSPLSDFSTEPGERWTATLVDTGAYNPAAGGDDNVGFDIDDLIAVVDIMTSDTTAIENGAVTLTITSDLAAPAGGLSVTIDISGNGLMTGEFTTNADCTGLQCVVIIPVGGMTVSLILSPLSDFSTEPGERWTATLVDTGAYNPAAGGDDNVAFDITDLIAAVGIATSDSAVEGGAVTLTITSDLAAPAGGLSVTIDISGNGLMTGEFTTNADCTGLQCVVIIPVGGMTVSLILSPLSDFSTEPGERWTATLVDTGAYNPAAGGDDNVVFDITDLIAAVGIIAASDSVMEGNAVVLTITSSIAAPTNGLTVTINIGGTDMDEFESGDCTLTECFVVIAATEMSAFLTITAAFDTDDRIAETWTATIMDVPAIFSTDSNADDADFQIDNPDLLATATNGIPLIQLDAAVDPDPLTEVQIRAGGDNDAGNSSRATLPITGFRYGDAATPDVFVQKLDFAHIGIWINGALADNDFDYAWLGENVVASPATTDSRGDAIYDVEGDATYKGFNFFPDGTMTMHFDSGTFDGRMQAFASDLDDDFGGITLPAGGGIFDLRITGGTITADGFEFTGTPSFGNTFGFFSDLTAITSFSMSGRFHDDSATYAPDMAAPTELSGVAEIIDGGGTNDLHMGFLGRRR